MDRRFVSRVILTRRADRDSKRRRKKAIPQTHPDSSLYCSPARGTGTKTLVGARAASIIFVTPKASFVAHLARFVTPQESSGQHHLASLGRPSVAGLTVGTTG